MYHHQNCLESTWCLSFVIKVRCGTEHILYFQNTWPCSTLYKQCSKKGKEHGTNIALHTDNFLRCRIIILCDQYCLSLPTNIAVYCEMRSVCFSFMYVQLTFWHQSFTFNSNKSPTWCNNFPVYYPDVCLQLNMFRAFSRPSSGAQWLQWQPLVLPSYHGDSHAVFVVGPAGCK